MSSPNLNRAKSTWREALRRSFSGSDESPPSRSSTWESDTSGATAPASGSATVIPMKRAKDVIFVLQGEKATKYQPENSEWKMTSNRSFQNSTTLATNRTNVVVGYKDWPKDQAPTLEARSVNFNVDPEEMKVLTDDLNSTAETLFRTTGQPSDVVKSLAIMEVSKKARNDKYHFTFEVELPLMDQMVEQLRSHLS